MDSGKSRRLYWLPTPPRMVCRILCMRSRMGLSCCWGFGECGGDELLAPDDSLVYVLFATFITGYRGFLAHTYQRVYLDVYWIVFAAGALAETGAGILHRHSQSGQSALQSS